MLEPSEGHEYKAGLRQTLRALRNGGVQAVLIAQDADPALLAPLLEAAQEKGIAVRRVRTMRELGRLCGIASGAAAAAQMR